jgi:tetratricopeptide (TPR) repeat protein
MKALFALGLLISSSAIASQAEIDKIESAYFATNSIVLTKLVTKNEHYSKALANYRLSILHNVNLNKNSAINAIASTINTLELAVKTTPEDAESWGLLSTSYGLMLSYQPELTKEYGQKSYEALKTAESIAPNNPRVHLFKAMINFNTPAAFGGDKNKAMAYINKAIDLYSYDRKSNHYWGEAEAYVWRGLIHQAMNENQKAAVDFTMALQIEPKLDWAKMLLTNIS